MQRGQLRDEASTGGSDDRARDRGACAVWLGRGRYGSMALVISSAICAAPARATCSASTPPMPFAPGTSRVQWPARLRQSPKPWDRQIGSACRLGTKGPRLHDWCYLELADLIEGHRWETAKNEFGLDHNETRSWHGWHRHVSFLMLAFAMRTTARSRLEMAAIRHQANLPAPKKTTSSARRKPPALSAGRFRKSIG